VQPNELLRVFIGYDSKESAAYHVLASSILRRATVPVAIIPLTRQSVSGVYLRERGPTEATEFSMTRFLVPYLSGYQGRSIFMDCDMVCRVDIGDLVRELDAQPDKAVWCCQHDYVPKWLTKFNGNEQTKYPRKNWSSFMVFDNAKCRALTPEYVNTATGLQLHRMLWTSDDRIGSLPLAWNWLVGEYEPNDAAKILHYTLGTPCFSDYAACDQADVWWQEFAAMTSPTPIAKDGAAWA
jgi:lipopolysaccharide biosynthesis glycosyltransferase